jgi:hypothetical protein
VQHRWIRCGFIICLERELIYLGMKTDGLQGHVNGLLQYVKQNKKLVNPS